MIPTPRHAGPDALDPKRATLIVVGDTQETAAVELVLERNHHLRPLLLAEITRRRPAGVLHLGDLVTWGASRRHWRRLDAELTELHALGIPLLPVVGNHDRWPWRRRAEVELAARFPVLEQRTWYTFRYAGVCFVALDSNFGAIGAARCEAQERWLGEVLAAAERDDAVRAIIGYWHHPAWTNSRLVRPSTRARERFVGALARSPKAIAAFTGHCHAYEHFEDMGLPLIVSGGGGGPRHPIEVRIDKRRRIDLSGGGKKSFLHFCELDLRHDHAELRVIRMVEGRDTPSAERFVLEATHSWRYRTGVAPTYAASLP